MIRKSLKKIFLSVVSLATTIATLGTTVVKADTVNVPQTMGYVASYSINGVSTGPKGTKIQITPIRVNGEVAFCLEPSEFLDYGNHNMTPSPLIGTIIRLHKGGTMKITQELVDKFAAANYFGYTTNVGNLRETAQEKIPGNSTKYWSKKEAFTQGFMWELVGNTVNFGVPGFEYLNTEYANFRKIMLQKMKLVTSKPSFNGKTFNLKVGEKVTITDTFGYFSSYQGNENLAGGTVKLISKSGNTLVFEGIASGTSKYSKALFPSASITKTTLVYSSGVKQKVTTAKVYDPGYTVLNFNVEPNTFNYTITKVNENQQFLPGTEFTLYNADGSPAKTKVVGADGKLVWENLTIQNAKITFKETKALDGYKLDPTVYTIDMNNPLANSKVIVNYKEDYKLQLIKENKQGKKLDGAVYRVTNKTTGNTQDVTITNGDVTLDKGQHLGDVVEVTEIKAPVGYILDKTPKTITIQKENNVVKFVNDTPIAQLTIVKSDETTGTKLAGAVFNLYKKGESTPISNYTTNSQGIIVISNLAMGDYEIKEVKAPNGYVLDSKRYPVSIKYVNQDTPVVKVNVNVTNKPSTTVITKTDISTGEKLPNTTIQIFKDGKMILEKVTDKNGNVIITGLTDGEYSFYETKAPVGYTLNPAEHKFTIKDGKVIHMDKLQDTKTEVRIHKVDANTLEKLMGVKFNLLNSKKEIIKKDLSTDKDGNINLFGLAVGNYFLEEVKTLENYQLKNTLVPFTVTDKNEPLNLTVTNAKYSKVVISKVDISDKKPLPDTEIAIYDNENKEIFRGRTDKDGKVTFDKITTPGKYYFLETDAPEGYVLNPDKHYFEVKENGQIIHSTLEDERNVEINKTDVDTNAPVPGAEITIKDINGKVVFVGKTDENGQIKVALPLGKYTYEETYVPEGYDKTVKISGIIEITEKGVKKVIRVTNKKLQIQPTLAKTGATKVVYPVIAGFGILALAFVLLKKKDSK